MVLEVLREIDGRHPARAELTLEAVTVAEGDGKAGSRLGHRRRDIPPQPRLPPMRYAEPNANCSWPARFMGVQPRPEEL
jgi:hypothetical protein